MEGDKLDAPFAMPVREVAPLYCYVVVIHDGFFFRKPVVCASYVLFFASRRLTLHKATNNFAMCGFEFDAKMSNFATD